MNIETLRGNALRNYGIHVLLCYFLIGGFAKNSFYFLIGGFLSNRHLKYTFLDISEK